LTEKRRRSARANQPHVSLARALSKLGYCSRAEGERLVRSGRVQVNARILRDPAARVDPACDRLAVDGRPVRAQNRVYLMLNKPRGLVTTASDERGRDTVFRCLPPDTPHVSPVGRLDRDSEGLLLFTNDTQWANQILAPAAHTERTYHVLVQGRLGAADVQRLAAGVTTRRGDTLAARARVLRPAGATTWLEVVLDEGRNRHIRRMLEALGFDVLRLIRVAIGPLRLGALPRGQTRRLRPAEVQAWSRPARRPPAT
jgi:23S rRNA pseudouridine2605 synthase